MSWTPVSDSSGTRKIFDAASQKETSRVKSDLGESRIEVVQGDITQETVDAIVNAANSGLRGGGGVDGAIHRAGGPAIMDECRKLAGCDTGDAKVTTGGNLAARLVIHAVGPVYRDGKHGEPDLLASCYRRSMELALQHGCASVAFPAISCGVYGYPIPDAASIAIRTVMEFLKSHHGITRVRFVLFSDDVRRIFEHALEEARES
ncbi:MAG: O-acetyl-ADP-ribose deacetylase [Candidatus Hydrogenedentes bacterium]|nr:O-acetyl-ADP-ribose deacetylase [Candidatus Hydrogenedentota bacterium]